MGSLAAVNAPEIRLHNRWLNAQFSMAIFGFFQDRIFVGGLWDFDFWISRDWWLKLYFFIGDLLHLLVVS